MITYPAAAIKHDRAMRALQLRAVAAGRKAWRRISLADLDASWDEAAPFLLRDLAQLQLDAAAEGAGYGGTLLAEQGSYTAPQAFVDPAGFAGTAADGRPLDSLLYSPIANVKTLIGGGMVPALALAKSRQNMDLLTKVTVADAGRTAAGVDVYARPRVSYVRMLNPPSCSRCVVLAGRVYRGNEGFLRHPRCDCTHVPLAESREDDMRVDPYEYFEGLSGDEQDKAFGKAGAQAIRDGGDLFQVVNARRGVSYAGVSADGTRRGQRASMVTREGTTKRGYYGSTAGAAFRKIRGGSKYMRSQRARLTPEAIYGQQLPREATLDLLQRNGYLIPGGQNPTGMIRGAGAGAYSKATRTAAQKRLLDAKLAWEAVLQGRNPYGKGPLTPEISARAEASFRRWTASRGEIFTK
ncbi:hypothetical protein [Arthrobacter sp. JSM 101049]|uniref:hypothetical protein n=1 Tax=Arthrobacter sp. JSM 101049 TaxID=929097 RepID=UPI0035664985